MIQRYNKIIILLLVVFAVSNAFAQQIKGVVTDSVTHEPLMYISVYYQDKRDMVLSPILTENISSTHGETEERSFSLPSDMSPKPSK